MWFVGQLLIHRYQVSEGDLEGKNKKVGICLSKAVKYISHSEHVKAGKTQICN